MIKILAIGNSFSQDATAYLHDIAWQGGIKTKVVNLYIGGCSLYTHWENISDDLSNYEYELNGSGTGRMVSIRETLLDDDWDFITMQQASCDSGILESYFPYIIQLSGYIKRHCPNAKLFIHQTWAYEIDSTHDAFARYDNNQINMYKALKDAYEKVSQALGIDLIPCGDVIQALRGMKQFDRLNNGRSLCRDGFHMDLVYGRYATAATWFESILKGNILENDYVPPDATAADNGPIELIKHTVHSVSLQRTTASRFGKETVKY